MCVRVSNRGPGIAEDSLAKVLLPFYRVEASHNRHTVGVGLCLASANDIVRRRGGNLEMHNRAVGGLQAELSFTRSHSLAPLTKAVVLSTH